MVPGGIRKLACLVRAMIADPQVLLLDDPSVGIGQDTCLKFFDCVQELRLQGKAQHVFISSFDEQLMGCLPHREIFIDCGQIYSESDPGEKKVVSL
jgi:ABC-type ATPase involved in cell division